MPYFIALMYRAEHPDASDPFGYYLFEAENLRDAMEKLTSRFPGLVHHGADHNDTEWVRLAGDEPIHLMYLVRSDDEPHIYSGHIAILFQPEVTS